MTTGYIDDDFVVVRTKPDGKAEVVMTLVFGDKIDFGDSTGGWIPVTILSCLDGKTPGYVRKPLRTRPKGILRLSMVDVQQGDGLILETPSDKILFIDGGENKLFARHAAERYRHRQTSDKKPLAVAAIILTHGDADHFVGLSQIVTSEHLEKAKIKKRLFIHPLRIYHNGLVKGPTKDEDKKSIPDTKQLGRTKEMNGRPYIIELYDDPRKAPAKGMNKHFKNWKKSLDHWEKRGTIEFRRIGYGSNEDELFDFLKPDGIKIEMLGPLLEVIPDGDRSVPALPFFLKPPKSDLPHLEHEDAIPAKQSPSASHTINGHSVAFRLTYGNVRFGFTGDLNKESMRKLHALHLNNKLESEIVKIPHHGSYDFDLQALKAMNPVVAIISSGDESVLKEHIHPRATLMAATGMAMQEKAGILLCTELAAFFAYREEVFVKSAILKYFRDAKAKSYTPSELVDLFQSDDSRKSFPRPFYGFERLNFGIIHIRTDGERVLVFTHSGKAGFNEAYRFSVKMEDGKRKIAFSPHVKTG